jgi:hypothetical protein
VKPVRLSHSLLFASLSILLAASFAHAAPAADPAAAPGPPAATTAATPVAAAPQPLDAATLAQDVTLLMRIAGIDLTDEQLDKLLAIYQAAYNAQPAELDARAAARARRRAKLDLTELEIKQITTVRERLIAGGVVAPHELQVAWRAVGAKRTTEFLPVGLRNNDLILQIAAVLTADQVAGLMRPLKNQIRARKQPGPVVEPVLARLTKLRDTDDEHWAAGADEIAKSAAVQAGTPTSDAYKQTYQNLMDCFSHLRKMSDMQFADGQKEILENLRVLFPADYDATTEVALTDRQKVQILTYIFLSTRTPVLLQEMKQARAGK